MLNSSTASGIVCQRPNSRISAPLCCAYTNKLEIDFGQNSLPQHTYTSVYNITPTVLNKDQMTDTGRS